MPGGGGGFRPPLEISKLTNARVMKLTMGGSPLCYEHFGIEIILLMSALFCLRQHFKIWDFDQHFPLKKKKFNNGFLQK